VTGFGVIIFGMIEMVNNSWTKSMTKHTEKTDKSAVPLQ